MKYYEIWFYYYGENDEKTDFNKEFTFYIKMDREIKDKIDLINELKNVCIIIIIKMMQKNIDIGLKDT